MKIFQFVESVEMSSHGQKLCCSKLCLSSDTKRNSGIIIDVFTSSLSDEEAASFAYDIVTLDYFLDLSGGMNDFLNQIRLPVRQVLDALISESHKLDADGNIVESDADSDGNLR
jgi:hypothetical protein